MSHELFHDVTEARPRQGKARGGTLFVSILAHVLILGAVVVVPLLASDVLPAIANGGLEPYAIPVVPPPPVAVTPAPARTRTDTPALARNIAPVEATAHPDPEPPPYTSIVCDRCVDGPASPIGVIGGIGTRIDAVVPPPPPPVTPPKIIRATALNMPKKIRDVAPEYPALALSAKVEGDVIIEAVIATDGSVRDARVLRSQPLLDRAAVDAVRQWHYEPTRLNGQPVPVIVTVTVRFRLQR
jgi:protein TonB